MKKNDLARGSLWLRRTGSLSLLIAVLVSALGILLDYLLVKEGLPRLGMLVLSNSVTGLFAGGLFYQVVREEKINRELMRARMKTIAELNHHIRNALQVIRFWGGQHRPELDSRQLQLINDSVNRIEWALREVLPKYEVEAATIPAPAPRAGPAA